MKTKKPSKTLALADALNAAVVPKPTKQELIEAMAQVQFQKEQAEWVEKRKRKQVLELEIEAALLDHVRENIATLKPKHGRTPGVYTDGKIGSGYVEFEIKNFPKEIERKIREVDSIRLPITQPTLEASRKLVRSRMQSRTPVEFSNRVNLLIKNAAPALESMLTELAEIKP